MRPRFGAVVLAVLGACRAAPLAVDPAATSAGTGLAPQGPLCWFGELQEVIERLQAGLAHLQSVAGYSARLVSHERIDGVLREPQLFDLRLRQRPFSVYLRCRAPARDAGREVLFSEEWNEGQLLVHTTGFLGALAGTLSLDPQGRLAMSDSRHPITAAGLERMAVQLIARLRAAATEAAAAAPRIGSGPARWGALELELVEIELAQQRVRIGFDPSTSVALAYALEELEGGEWRFMEEYRFEQLDWSPLWTDADFRPDCPAYGF